MRVRSLGMVAAFLVAGCLSGSRADSELGRPQALPSECVAAIPFVVGMQAGVIGVEVGEGALTVCASSPKGKITCTKILIEGAKCSGR